MEKYTEQQKNLTVVKLSLFLKPTIFENLGSHKYFVLWNGWIILFSQLWYNDGALE